jgi:hypothetical protein
MASLSSDLRHEGISNGVIFDLNENSAKIGIFIAKNEVTNVKGVQ